MRYIYIYIHTHIIYVYIYIEREREIGVYNDDNNTHCRNSYHNDDNDNGNK